jgi:hypothetical protein
MRIDGETKRSGMHSIAWSFASWLALIAITGASAAPPVGTPAHRIWHVSASAPAGGDGSASAPFNSLAAVEQVSAQVRCRWTGPGCRLIPM